MTNRKGGDRGEVLAHLVFSTVWIAIAIIRLGFGRVKLAWQQLHIAMLRRRNKRLKRRRRSLGGYPDGFGFDTRHIVAKRKESEMKS